MNLDTLETAVGPLPEVFIEPGPSKLTLRKPDEILGMHFSDADNILGDRLMARGQNFVLAGASGVGKSRLALQLSAAIVTSRKFLDFETRSPGLKWLFVQAENSNRRLQFDLAHLRAWMGQDWPMVNERLAIHTLETDGDGLLNLDSEQNRQAILDLITETKPDVVVWDSLYNFGIGDLNKDADMLATLSCISMLSRYGNPERSIVVLHHALTGRAGAARATGYDRASFGRNSKVLHAWTRGQLNVAAGSPDNNDTLVFSCGKCSNGREFESFAARLNQETFIYEPAPDFDLAGWNSDMTGQKSKPVMTPQRVRELCPMTGSNKAALVQTIMADCFCSRATAYRHVRDAESAKQIVWKQTNESYYRK